MLKPTVSVVLLGDNEQHCGKFVFKYLLQVMYDKVTDEHRAKIAPQIHKWFVTKFRHLMDLSVIGLRRKSLGAASEDFKAELKSFEDSKWNEEVCSAMFLSSFAEKISKSWASPEVQKFWRKDRREGRIFTQSLKYFAENAGKIFQRSYVPDDNDLLQFAESENVDVKVSLMPCFLTIDSRTVQVQDLFLAFDGKIIGYKGQPDLVIYFSSLADYNVPKFLSKDVTVLLDSLDQFEKVSSLKEFVSAPFVLVLSNKELFEQKLKSFPLSDFFPDYPLKLYSPEAATSPKSMDPYEFVNNKFQERFARGTDTLAEMSGKKPDRHLSIIHADLSNTVEAKDIIKALFSKYFHFDCSRETKTSKDRIGTTDGLDESKQLQVQKGLQTSIQRDKVETKESEIWDRNAIALIGQNDLRCGKYVFKYLADMTYQRITDEQRSEVAPRIRTWFIRKFHHLLNIANIETSMGASTAAFKSELKILRDPEVAKDDFSVTFIGKIKNSWKDAAVQKFWSKELKSGKSFSESFEHFVENAEKIFDKSYSPDDNDLLKFAEDEEVKMESLSNHLIVNSHAVEIIDPLLGYTGEVIEVLGETIGKVVFFCPLAVYCATLNPTKHKILHELMSQFQKLASQSQFSSASFTLILTKKDLFERRLKMVPLTVCFPEYNAPKPEEPSSEAKILTSPEAEYEFLFSQFRKRYADGTAELESKLGKTIDRQLTIFCVELSDIKQAKALVKEVLGDKSVESGETEEKLEKGEKEEIEEGETD